MYFICLQWKKYQKKNKIYLLTHKLEKSPILYQDWWFFLTLMFCFNTNLTGVSFLKRYFYCEIIFPFLVKNIVFTRNLCYNLYENNVCWRVDYIWNSCRPFSVVFTRARYKRLSKTEVVVFKTSVFLLVKYQLRWCEIIYFVNCEIESFAFCEMK